MGRQYTGKQITRTAEVKQKNGDVYVYERVYQYDRDKKKTVVVSNRLIGKRRAGQTELEPMGASQELLLPAAPEKEPAPGMPPGAVQPLSAAELLSWTADRSCLEEAAELCLPDATRLALVKGLWEALICRETELKDPVPGADAELRRLVGQAHGLMETLLRLRLLEASGEALTLIALAGSPGHIFFLRDGVLLGVRELPEMLSVPAGAERVWSDLGAGDLVMQRSFVDLHVNGLADIRSLERRTFDFVCPLSLSSELSQRLLAETSLSRRQPQSFLEEEDAWASTFPLRQGDTLEIAEGTGAELYLHIYSFPARKDREAAEFDAELNALLTLLTQGTPQDDLDEQAQNLRRRYLREDSAGLWSRDPEACRRHTEKLGCLMLIANGERDAGGALRLVRSASQWRRWLSRLSEEGRDLRVEVLIRLLKDSLEDLVKEARSETEQAGGFAQRLVDDAAGAFLHNATLGEILSVVLGAEPEQDAAKARRIAVSDRIRRTAEMKKAAAGK